MQFRRVGRDAEHGETRKGTKEKGGARRGGSRNGLKCGGLSKRAMECGGMGGSGGFLGGLWRAPWRPLRDALVDSWLSCPDSYATRHAERGPTRKLKTETRRQRKATRR
eukprot:7921420-Pyramimonas_sp.AAC.1